MSKSFFDPGTIKSQTVAYSAFKSEPERVSHHNTHLSSIFEGCFKSLQVDGITQNQLFGDVQAV